MEYSFVVWGGRIPWVFMNLPEHYRKEGSSYIFKNRNSIAFYSSRNELQILLSSRDAITALIHVSFTQQQLRLLCRATICLMRFWHSMTLATVKYYSVYELTLESSIGSDNGLSPIDNKYFRHCGIYCEYNYEHWIHCHRRLWKMLMLSAEWTYKTENVLSNTPYFFTVAWVAERIHRRHFSFPFHMTFWAPHHIHTATHVFINQEIRQSMAMTFRA